MLPQQQGVLNELLKKVENPSARIVSMVQRILDRILALDLATKNSNPDLISFFWCRCATQEVAFQQQQQCDELANQYGPVVVQKLNKTKKNKPPATEEKAFYYTQLVVGFDGLCERAKSETEFFSNFAIVIKELQKRQEALRIRFQEQAIDKLKVIRDSQCELRHKALVLVQSLAELARQRQGFEMDPEDSHHLGSEYDRILRRLCKSPNCLSVDVETLGQGLRNISQLQQRHSLPPLSYHQAERILQLKSEIAKHQDELELIKQKLLSQTTGHQGPFMRSR